MENNQSHSPVPSKKEEIKQMTFPEAIQAILAGHKITRVLWDDREEYCLTREGWLMIHTKKESKLGAFHKWLISDGDYLADDWIILS